jgi:hypothetical protein
MYFKIKNILKNNRNHTSKHTLFFFMWIVGKNIKDLKDEKQCKRKNS